MSSLREKNKISNTNKAVLSGKEILRKKVHDAMLADDFKKGKTIRRTDGGLFKVAKVCFFISGIYVILVLLLNIAVLLGVISADYPYSDQFKAFTVPVALSAVITITALICGLLKKQITACYVACAALIPEIIHFVQTFGVEKTKTTGYTNLFYFYLASLIFQLCAFTCIFIRNSQRKRENDIYEKIVRKLYHQKGKTDEILSNEELDKLCREYNVKIK